MINDAPSLAPAVFAFGFAGIACVTCFLASAADDLGLAFPRLPSINWAAFRSPATAQAKPPGPVFPAIPVRPLAPVYCEASGRFRDPVTRRFIKAPR
jgi:hypothetical protein